LSPFEPVRPIGPWAPAGSCPAAKSPAFNDPFFTFDELTAFFLICFEPTLFLGSFSAA
jgi:hypothetical protein